MFIHLNPVSGEDFYRVSFYRVLLSTISVSSLCSNAVRYSRFRRTVCKPTKLAAQ